jgi:hypothetical protein
MSGILNTTGAVSGILGKSVLPVGVTGGSGLDESPRNGRNMIINGGMQVWQRATATTTTNNAYQTVDRFKSDRDTDGAYTWEKHDMSLAELNTTGHATALQLDVTTADTSIAVGQYAYFYQKIEAQNCQHLQWGTAAAKDVTLSFWVKSNKTGIYIAGIIKHDTTSYYLHSEYTIDVANTWEYKTITFTPTMGNTTLITGAGGIIANDNGLGIKVHFGLTWGSQYTNSTPDTWATGEIYASPNQVNWMDSTSNNFYITGIQFEAGSVATPFEHRSYGDELAKCQRYYEKSSNGTNSMSASYLTSYFWTGLIPFNTTKRDTPTLIASVSGGYWANPTSQAVGAAGAKTIAAIGINTHSTGLKITHVGGNAGPNTGFTYVYEGTFYIEIISEL